MWPPQSFTSAHQDITAQLAAQLSWPVVPELTRMNLDRYSFVLRVKKKIGDNCIQKFHLGRYIVEYKVRNVALR